MRSFLLVATILCALTYVAYAAEPMESGRGWGDDIVWYSYAEGLKEAEETGKDIMFVFHSTSCGACKRLKPLFSENKEIAEYSKNFVMINVQNSEKPSADSIYQKDGGYIPRIYFADSNGKPDYSVSSGNASYGYFYSSDKLIASQMKKVIDA